MSDDRTTDLKQELENLAIIPTVKRVVKGRKVGRSARPQPSVLKMRSLRPVTPGSARRKNLIPATYKTNNEV